MSLINVAQAATETTTTAATHAAHKGSMGFFWVLILVFVGFYAWMMYSQKKKSKARAKVLGAVQSGDEILTTSGISGRVTNVDEQSMSVMIAKDVEVNFQKNAVISVLPKGTIKNF